MKTVFIGICSGAILLLLVVFSCERNEVEMTTQEQAIAVAKTLSTGFDPNNDIVANLVEGNLELAISQETLERAIKKANPKIEGISNYEFRVDANGGEEYGNAEVAFLIIYVDLKDGGHQSMAFDLKLAKDKTFYHINMVTGVSSCTGHCCSKCQWSKPAGSPYYKCWCVSPDTRDGCGTNSAGCDHTLTIPKTGAIKKVE